MTVLGDVAVTALLVWNGLAGAKADTTVLERSADAPRPVALQSIASDTVRAPRKKAFEYSDAYTWRLEWHRRLSWAMLPLFAASYVSGDQLLKASQSGTMAPSWARPVHQVAASSSAVLFGLNGVTGALNLWEGLGDPNGRTRRVVHSLSFMASSAGFVYAGTQLAGRAQQRHDMRLQHRNVALASIGVSTASWLYMLIAN